MRVNGTTLIRKDGNATYSMGRCGGNGQSWQISGENELYTCSEAISRQNIQRVDGGYYVYLPPGWVNQNFQLAGGSPVCAGAASSSSGGGEGGEPTITCNTDNLKDCYETSGDPMPRPNVSCGDGITLGTTYFSIGPARGIVSGWQSGGSHSMGSAYNNREIYLDSILCNGTKYKTSPLPIKCAGKTVNTAASCGSTSSSSVTITCNLKDKNNTQSSSLSVTQGENITTPAITCTNGATPGINNANYTNAPNSTGTPWRTVNGTAHYTSSVTGNQSITVSNVTCGSGETYSATCGTINVDYPGCTIPAGDKTVNVAFQPEVTCRNATPGNRTFSFNCATGSNCCSTNGNNVTCTTAGQHTVNLASVTCDNSVTSLSRNCGQVNVAAAPQAPNITCNTSNLKPCYATSGDPMPRPNVSCGDGIPLGITYFSIGSPGNPRTDVGNWQNNGGTNQMGSAHNNREIYLDRIICNDVEYNSSNTSSSLPKLCGTVNTGNCGNSGGTPGNFTNLDLPACFSTKEVLVGSYSQTNSNLGNCISSQVCNLKLQTWTAGDVIVIVNDGTTNQTLTINNSTEHIKLKIPFDITISGHKLEQVGCDNQ